MAADRTPNELADALEAQCVFGGPDDACGECLKCAAAVLLRRQGEQLDTLRNAIEAIVYGDSIPISAEVYRMLDAALAAAGGGVPQEGARFVEVDYWCHFDDKGRATRVHDASTVHMDGCTRMYVRLPQEGATDE